MSRLAIETTENEQHHQARHKIQASTSRLAPAQEGHQLANDQDHQAREPRRYDDSEHGLCDGAGLIEARRHACLSTTFLPRILARCPNSQGRSRTEYILYRRFTLLAYFLIRMM